MKFVKGTANIDSVEHKTLTAGMFVSNVFSDGRINEIVSAIREGSAEDSP